LQLEGNGSGVRVREMWLGQLVALASLQRALEASAAVYTGMSSTAVTKAPMYLWQETRAELESFSAVEAERISER
jgi:hypothetical protein